MANSFTNLNTIESNLPGEPKDVLLKCYNALDPKVAKNPYSILHNLTDYRKNPLTRDKVNETIKTTRYTKDLKETSSSDETYLHTALSVGVSASYAGFSASCQVDNSTDHHTLVTSYNANLAIAVDNGTVDFYQRNNVDAIKDLLDPGMITALNNVKSFTDAEDFTTKYGTHVITSVKLGGLLNIIFQIDTNSVTDKNTLHTKIKAGYSGLGAKIEATTDIMNSIETIANNSKNSTTFFAIGGEAEAAALVDLFNNTTISNWVATCKNSISTLAESKEIWKLATDANAKKILKDYVHLCLLKNSIEHPVIFTQATPIVIPSRSAFASNISNASYNDFKIISGGTMMVEDGYDYIISSYPIFDGNNRIMGWKSDSMNLVNPTKVDAYMVTYAIGIYDPEDMLTVSTIKKNGENTTSRQDAAEATMLPGFTLTGGGGDNHPELGNIRLLTSCYPNRADDNSPYDSWVTKADNKDLKGTAKLTTWAIGIKLSSDYNDALKISNNVISIDTFSGASFTPGIIDNSVAGGGMKISIDNDYYIKASFPILTNDKIGWQGYSANSDGKASVTTTSFVIMLNAKSNVKSVTFKPYE